MKMIDSFSTQEAGRKQEKTLRGPRPGRGPAFWRRGMDTILYHGVVHTMAGRTVSALAVGNGRIALAGSDGDALALAGPETKKIDLGGRCVLPGFVDTHMHALMIAEAFHRLDLRGVTSEEEIIRRGREYIEKNALSEGEWIVGYGYDHNLFSPPVIPNGSVAEAISRKNPVILDRICGHVGCGNAKALALAGFSRDSALPGDVLERDEKGNLTGIVREAPLDTLKGAIPRMDTRRVIARLREAGRRMAAAGLTGAHSDDLLAGGTLWPNLKEAFGELERSGEVPFRLWQEWEAPTVKDLEEVLKQPWRSGEGTDWLRLGNVKLYTDGSLGARTALLREDYNDDPGNRGIAVYSQEALDELIGICHENDLQVACHAIGDGGCAQVVAAVEKAMAKNPKPLHHRVIHCQFGDKALYEKMGGLGMGADVQPAFIPSDALLAAERVGARAAAVETAYAWKTLLSCGVIVGGGSDSPVESFAPLWGIHCAVNRPTAPDDETAFLPEQRLTVEEAVRLYTTAPAVLGFAERELGTLEAGKWADLVVLDRDIFTVPHKRIKDLKVELTMLGGRVTYRAGNNLISR